MLAVNIDIQARLIYGQTGHVKHVKLVQGAVCKVYIKFSNEEAGLEGKRSFF